MAAKKTTKRKRTTTRKSGAFGLGRTNKPAKRKPAAKRKPTKRKTKRKSFHVGAREVLILVVIVLALLKASEIATYLQTVTVQAGPRQTVSTPTPAPAPAPAPAAGSVAGAQASTND